MKLVKRTVLIIFLLGFGILAYLYFGTYSDGFRSGVVVKVSKKGFLFKTYEGQLNLLTFGASKSNNMVAETFEFSVPTSDTEVVKALEEVSLSGERVSLHYVEKFVTFPWRGDTKYLIIKVERLPAGK
jgi:hypothetical protein